MKADHATGDIEIVVVGRAATVTTGFDSAIAAEGWRWAEVPDVLSLFARSRSANTVIALPIIPFVPSAYAAIYQLTVSPSLPVIVFGIEQRSDVVHAVLQAGADDYVPLPVTIEEMIARFSAVIRVHFGARDSLDRSDYRLDDGKHAVAVCGGPVIRLSVGEYQLFRMLLVARNRLVARERLALIPLPYLPGDGPDVLGATMNRLQQKLEDGRLVTIREIGYRLVDYGQAPKDLSSRLPHAGGCEGAFRVIGNDDGVHADRAYVRAVPISLLHRD